MSFVSEFRAMRTFDPESGWELFRVPMGVGSETFILQHSTEGSIHFWGNRTRLEETGKRLPDGRNEALMVFDVRNIDAVSTSLTTEQQQKLIAEAVKAFGFAHNGPLGPTEVLFRGKQDLV